MTTPIETLYAAAKERQQHGIRVISIDFVINMIEREQTFYRLPPRGPLETFNSDHRQSV